VEIVVRHARLQDAPSIARIHVEAWRAAYRGLVPDEVLDGLSVKQREQLWRQMLAADKGRLVFVAGGGDEIAGFCGAVTPARGTDAGEGIAEIGAIYVSPCCWRTGLGRALMEAAVAELRAGGWRSLQLWVLAGNDRAKQFYERLGFEADGAEKLDRALDRTELRMSAPIMRVGVGEGAHS
jgi:ribosomal protein S18 acetylase RimI-like enzyme